MATVVRVTIYDSQIAAFFLPGGDTWNWMQRVGFEHMQMAAIEAPSRTNRLRSLHNLALTPVGRNQCRYSVGNYADYAAYVHEGTTGPITSTGWDDGSPAFMAIRPAPSSRFPNGGYLREVSGQTANPWLSRAGNIVLAKYGLKGPTDARWG